MTVKIVTDSGANSFSGIIGGVEHVNVPLTVMVNGQSWADDDQLDLNNFLSALKTLKRPLRLHVQTWEAGSRLLKERTKFSS